MTQHDYALHDAVVDTAPSVFTPSRAVLDATAENVSTPRSTPTAVRLPPQTRADMHIDGEAKIIQV